MSISTEITRLTNAKAAIKAAIEGKGVTVPDATLMDGMAALIESIEAGGGGGRVTCGTITPLTKIYEIEHSLGVVPKAFIWLITFNNTMSGQDMGPSGLFSDEKAYSTKDITNTGAFQERMVCFVIGEYVYSLSFGNSVDWGFFTKGSIDTKPTAAILDETKFKSKYVETTLLPYSTSGNITINWFAIGGA